jgi:Fur family peroxide stress response transcriptional regulator
LATVYRNIGLFMNEGSVVSVGVVKGEERFDGRTEPHPHLVCSRCGRVCDMDCPNPRAMGDIGGLHSGEQGFAIDYRKTVFYGVCGECNTAGSARHEKG